MMIMCCVFLQAGWTPLHVAAYSGHVDMVDFLLKHNPEVITQTDFVSVQ